jgi:hypothetical protein
MYEIDYHRVNPTETVGNVVAESVRIRGR